MGEREELQDRHLHEGMAPERQNSLHLHKPLLKNKGGCGRLAEGERYLVGRR